MSPEDERIDGVKDEKVFIVRPLPWRAGRCDAFMEWIENIRKLHWHVPSFEYSHERLVYILIDCHQAI